jgi:hypothetical protein
VLSALLSCKFIVFCEDFLFGVTQVLQGSRIIGYGNLTKFGGNLVFVCDPIRVISVIRGQKLRLRQSRAGSSAVKNFDYEHEQEQEKEQEKEQERGS